MIDPRDVHAAPAVVEERPDRVREIVVRLVVLVFVLELVQAAEDALEVGEAREELWDPVEGTVAGGADEPRRARAHAFDRLGAKADFLDVHSGR